MRNILLFCAWVGLVLTPLSFAPAKTAAKTKVLTKAKKEEVLPVRKGKKGKIEPLVSAVKKSITAPPQAKPMITNLHPQAQVKLKAAMKDMQAAGVCPSVTSAYRSNAEQQAMYRCAHQHRCRVARGIYGARKPGTSLHEAGLAVDFASVAVGKKHHRRLTSDGRKVVKVMQKHGFKWRYGLQDPAHFELEPRVAGFRSEQQAILVAQQHEAKAQVLVKKSARHSSRKTPRRSA